MRVRYQSDREGRAGPGATALKPLLAVAILAAAFLAGCGARELRIATPQATKPGPTAEPTRTPFPFTPVPFEELPPYPTPEGYSLPTLQFPEQVLPEGVMPAVAVSEGLVTADAGRPYYLVGQKQIGRYAVRYWLNSWLGTGIATISDGSDVLVQVEAERLEVSHAGQDITGEGNPDVVVELLGRGWSYLSVSTQVFDLGAVLTKVLDAPWVATDPVFEVSCPWFGAFSDLEGDGSAEFITCDDAPRWGGFYGAANSNLYAEHRRLMVMAILEYEPGQGYVPAGPRFASLYEANIAGYTRRAEEEATADYVVVEGYGPQALVALALNYLYSGRPERAWAEIERIHRGPDKVLLWSEILQQANRSFFYAAEGTFPDVPVPEYYALRLRPAEELSLRCSGTPEVGQPTCEPAALSLLGSHLIILSEEGQDPGDADVAVRSVYWLGEQLRRGGVIGRGQQVQASALDWPDNCRVHLVSVSDWGDVGPPGFVLLDACGDLPSEVVRVDSLGNEMSRWRLRGDLTWERVAPHRKGREQP